MDLVVDTNALPNLYTFQPSYFLTNSPTLIVILECRMVRGPSQD